MKSLFRLVLIAPLAIMLNACGNGDELEAKKAELTDVRTQIADLTNQAKQLETEIAELDPEYGQNDGNVVLVSTTAVNPSKFEHKIEVRGTVESRKNVMVSAETAGRIESIKVREGQNVKKGDLLLMLDADVIRNNIAELKTSLELAEIVFQRQSNLWDKKIGTEIQYLETKNRKESLERKLTTAHSQLAMANVRAPFTGSIDDIPVKVGEMAAPGAPLIRIVNPNEMYIKAEVSENYIGRFVKGDPVEIHFPSQNENLVSKISSVGNVLNKENRTFSLEILLPEIDFTIKPNQVAVLKLTDYTNATALVIPTKLIQRDDIGTFIYRVENDGVINIAKKMHVETGMSYNSKTEIKSGLEGNEKIIEKGFREVTDGVEVNIATAQNSQ
ncbi:MAG: efflux RND transporter periplasmic adaptor subunit [Cyclobacteriaceae bacterium]